MSGFRQRVQASSPPGRERLVWWSVDAEILWNPFDSLRKRPPSRGRPAAGTYRRSSHHDASRPAPVRADCLALRPGDPNGSPYLRRDAYLCEIRPISPQPLGRRDGCGI